MGMMMPPFGAPIPQQQIPFQMQQGALINQFFNL
jgi:hypothetical protein